MKQSHGWVMRLPSFAPRKKEVSFTNNPCPHGFRARNGGIRNGLITIYNRVMTQPDEGKSLTEQLSQVHV